MSKSSGEKAILISMVILSILLLVSIGWMLCQEDHAAADQRAKSFQDAWKGSDH